MPLVKASEWQEDSHEWLIEGIISSAITVLSGEPKLGKTLLMGYAVNSLITQTPFLGIQPRAGTYKVAWMGYDSLWAPELRDRFPNILESLYFSNPIRYDNTAGWEELEDDLVSESINLLVIDHLYGLAEGVDLDESHEWDKAISPVKRINTKLNIPTVLVAQAGKTGTGRVAHTVSIEGTARHILRLKGSIRNSKRTIESVGNYIGNTEIAINLSPDSCELIHMVSAADRQSRERTGEAPRNAKRLMDEAPAEALKNKTAAGKWLKEQGLSETADGGRTAVGRYISCELLGRDGPNGPIVRGRKLLN